MTETINQIIITEDRTPNECIKAIYTKAEELKKRFKIIHCYEPDIHGQVRKYIIIAKLTGNKAQAKLNDAF